jgi:ERCC4-type nuclease
VTPQPIFVDDRAGSCDLLEHEPVRSLGEKCRLDSGDVCITGNGPQGPLLVGVEVKSIWDLISSINTGRLQATQLPALLATYDVAWLLYFGSYRPGRDGRLEVRRGKMWREFRLGTRPVPYGYVESFLLDCSAIGVRVRYAYDAREACAWLGVLHRWWSKPWSQHKGMRTLDNSRELSLMPNMDGPTHLRAKVAAQLPGVGFERALAAAEHFSSVCEMVCADAAEWARVPGIGKVVAKAVVAAARNE